MSILFSADFAPTWRHCTASVAGFYRLPEAMLANGWGNGVTCVRDVVQRLTT